MIFRPFGKVYGHATLSRFADDPSGCYGEDDERELETPVEEPEFDVDAAMDKLRASLERRGS